MRGNYELAHQSQTLQRDLKAEEINSSRGEVAAGYVCRNTKDCGGYTFLVRSPGHPTLAWTAFHDRRDLTTFVDAYGLKLKGSLTPGSHFEVQIPSKPKMRKLRCG